MGEVIDPSKTVRHRVRGTEACIRERKSGVKAGKERRKPQFQVFGVFDDRGQRAVDEPYRLEGVQVGHRGTGIRYIGLDRVAESIHAGIHGQFQGHRRQRSWVEQGDVGNQRFRDEGNLTPSHLIRDDCELRDVGGTSGGRRDADERRCGHRHPVDALKREDILHVGTHDPDTLGAVHRATPADGDDTVAFFGMIHLRARHHLP